MSHPRIGLNCDVAAEGSGKETLRLNWDYAEAVVRAGGLPVLLAPVEGDELVGESLAGIGGLVLTGGRDYDPALYGRARHPATRLLSPRRMAFDLALARAALAARVPVLGVCGGAQLINLALGGTLVQDIPTEVPGAHPHAGGSSGEVFHEVTVEEGTRLARIVGAGRLEVNSSHHQAVERPGKGLRIVARSADGVVEAVETAPAVAKAMAGRPPKRSRRWAEGEAFVLGVQWHPERMLEREVQVALFRALADAAQRT